MPEPVRHDATFDYWRKTNPRFTGDDVAPMPGTKRVSRVEENTAADRLELSAGQINRLNHLVPAAGERHDAGNMAVIER